MWTIPNILTIFRLLLLPPMVWLFFVPMEWAAWACLALYVIASITDFLDGWIARKYNLISDFGTMMDPISDKIFVVVTMLMLVAVGRVEDLMVIPILLIITREFAVSGVREFLGPKGVKMPVSKLAKWKTATQMIALGFLIIAPYSLESLMAGNLLLILATALTLVTGWAYVKTGLDHVK